MRAAMTAATRATVIATMILLASAAQAQQAAPPARMAFEVASIKPNTSDSGHTHTSDKPGGVVMTNVSLRRCLLIAFDVQESELVGPDWLETTRFDIMAKPPDGHPEDYYRPMLKSLLEDRFKLSVHRETRVMPVYALAVAKGGLKVKEVAAGESQTATSRRQFTGTKVSMPDLANFLARILNRAVVNKTDAKGVFDIKLEFAPENPSAAEPQRAEGQAASGPPSIFTALQEQLGLKLQPEKLPVEVVVVDHIERVPTEN
jgi:bla regulator protein blaR1